MSNVFDSLIWSTAQRHGIDPPLLKAVVAAESSFNPRAFRDEPHIGDASYGLMQTLYRTAKDMGYTGAPEGLYDPATSLEMGARYLARQLRRYGGKVPYAVAAYNSGTAFFAKDGSGRFVNQSYVDRVFRFYERYKAAEESEADAGVRLRPGSPQMGPVPGSTPVRVAAVAGPEGERGATLETFITEDTAPWLIAVGGAVLLSVLSGRRR